MSLDDKYVADQGGALMSGIGGNFCRYDVFGADPEREVFGNVWDGWEPGAPDAFRRAGRDEVRADGQLYCTVMGAGHIAVFDEQGRVVERIETDGAAHTNIAFTEDGQHKMYVIEISKGAVAVFDVACDGLPIYRDAVEPRSGPAATVGGGRQRTTRS